LLGKFLRRDDVVLQITEVMPFPNTTEIWKVYLVPEFEFLEIRMLSF
jgi:hypothetical protein